MDTSDPSLNTDYTYFLAYLILQYWRIRYKGPPYWRVWSRMHNIYTILWTLDWALSISMNFLPIKIRLFKKWCILQLNVSSDFLVAKSLLLLWLIRCNESICIINLLNDRHGLFPVIVKFTGLFIFDTVARVSASAIHGFSCPH